MAKNKAVEIVKTHTGPNGLRAIIAQYDNAMHITLLENGRTIASTGIESVAGALSHAMLPARLCDYDILVSPAKVGKRAVDQVLADGGVYKEAMEAYREVYGMCNRQPKRRVRATEIQVGEEWVLLALNPMDIQPLAPMLKDDFPFAYLKGVKS